MFYLSSSVSAGTLWYHSMKDLSLLKTQFLQEDCRCRIWAKTSNSCKQRVISAQSFIISEKSAHMLAALVILRNFFSSHHITFHLIISSLRYCVTPGFALTRSYYPPCTASYCSSYFLRVAGFSSGCSRAACLPALCVLQKVKLILLLLSNTVYLFETLHPSKGCNTHPSPFVKVDVAILRRKWQDLRLTTEELARFMGSVLR